MSRQVIKVRIMFHIKRTNQRSTISQLNQHIQKSHRYKEKNERHDHRSQFAVKTAAFESDGDFLFPSYCRQKVFMGWIAQKKIKVMARKDYPWVWPWSMILGQKRGNFRYSSLKPNEHTLSERTLFAGTLTALRSLFAVKMNAARFEDSLLV